MKRSLPMAVAAGLVACTSFSTVQTMPELNLATIVQTSCNGTCADNTGGLGIQGGIGFHFDR